MPFTLQSSFEPTGDQPMAIKKILASLEAGNKFQTLVGVTGSGKTFSMAKIIEARQKPVLIISHNKTLAAQLYNEFREFFPTNAVHYFVSYYDYYQPEAYIPQTDTYIEKESSINEEIDRLRHAATQALINRDDVIIVASVSCIYGIGEKSDYESMSLHLERGQMIKRNDILRKLVKIQYHRNDTAFVRGQFRVRGENIDIKLMTGEGLIRINMIGDRIDRIMAVNSEFEKMISGEGVRDLYSAFIIPAKHFMSPDEKISAALRTIREELGPRLEELRKAGKEMEAHRLEQKTNYDLEMIEAVGYCGGIENYSRHFSGREPGSAPSTLIDFFPSDFLIFIDESHVSLPQIQGMYAGDQSRKATLIDFGFRLPSARDNRPLNFEEFEKKIKQVVYVSATPREYELGKSKVIAEQIIRPTGLLDPEIEVRSSEGQVQDLIKEITIRTEKNQRVLVTTLTKRMAEELSGFLSEQKIKVQYIHNDVDTIERIDILRDLRSGKYDVLVGINLLREGLDLPEVSLVAILDADMSGFLRNDIALMQTMGRAARHEEGRVIMYADRMSPAMKFAIKETKRRRKIQEAYNVKHGIIPKSTKAREIRSIA